MALDERMVSRAAEAQFDLTPMADTPAESLGGGTSTALSRLQFETTWLDTSALMSRALPLGSLLLLDTCVSYVSSSGGGHLVQPTLHELRTREQLLAAANAERMALLHRKHSDTGLQPGEARRLDELTQIVRTLDPAVTPDDLRVLQELDGMLDDARRKTRRLEALVNRTASQE